MKKIIALMLTLVCVLALVACRPEETVDHSALEPYKAAVESTAPARATVNITYTDTALNVSLEGSYVVEYNEDGTATVTYEYDKLNEIGESDEMLTTVNGIATVKADGTVEGDVDTKVTAAAAIKINLDPEKLTYTVARGILTATVKASDTAAVLGVELGSDVSMTMTVSDGGNIGSVSYSYQTESGVASVVCFYE